MCSRVSKDSNGQRQSRRARAGVKGEKRGAPIDAERAIGERDAAREGRELVGERGEHAGRLRRIVLEQLLLLVLRHRGLYAAAVRHRPRALEQPTAAAAAGERPHRRAHRADRQTREVALDALPPALPTPRLHCAQVLQCDTHTTSDQKESSRNKRRIALNNNTSRTVLCLVLSYFVSLHESTVTHTVQRGCETGP